MLNCKTPIKEVPNDAVKIVSENKTFGEIFYC